VQRKGFGLQGLQIQIEDYNILRACPPIDQTIFPVAFPKGSSDIFDAVMYKIKTFWNKNAPENVNEWIQFKTLESIPDTDSIEDYLNQHPQSFYIPLENELFRKVLSQDDMRDQYKNTCNSTQKLINELPVTIAQPIVSWSNRGNKIKGATRARELVETSEQTTQHEAAIVEHTKPIEQKKRKAKLVIEPTSQNVLDQIKLLLKKGDSTGVAMTLNNTVETVENEVLFFLTSMKMRFFFMYF